MRLPAPLSGAALAWGVATLARDATGERRVGFAAAAIIMLTPFHQGLSLIMSIDGPYMACWAWAAVFARRAMLGRSRPAWIALGLALGAGFLFKYTIMLLIPGLIWCAIARRRDLKLAARWPIAAAAGAMTAMLGAGPVLIWNINHEWATVAHQLGHLGVAGGDTQSSGWRYQPRWTFELIATQLLLVGPAIALVIHAVLASRSREKSREPDAKAADRAFLILCSLPILIFYLGVTFMTDAEGNWPLAGYVTLCALAGWGLIDAIDKAPAAPRRRLAWRITLVFGLVTGLGMLRVDLFAKLPGLSGLIPIGRLTDASVMGQDAARIAHELAQETGLEPFIAAEHYGRASTLAFYMPGRPTVYCPNFAMGSRPTAYDFWPETDLTDPQLLGRPALLVGATPDRWSGAFARVKLHGTLAGDHKEGRPAILGYGYHGFPNDPAHMAPP